MAALVFVVEDNALNRELLRAVLARCGHDVVEASSVAEARDVLSRCVPDLALVDIQIPGGTGEDVLRAIRESAAHRGLCVVAVTAFAMHNDRERMLSAGFDDYVSKPIDTRAIVGQLGVWLKRREPAA